MKKKRIPAKKHKHIVTRVSNMLPLYKGTKSGPGLQIPPIVTKVGK